MLVHFHHKWYFQRFPPPRGFDPYSSVICRRLLACKPCSCPILKFRSLETWTEMEVYWTCDCTHLSKRSWSNISLCMADSWQDITAICITGEEGHIYRGNWCQVGSSVTRETSSRAPPSQSHRLPLPCLTTIMAADIFLQSTSRFWPND